jgi:CelD/BcsL family acetyltransferase involved in cellulose biosynthesis
VAYTGSEEIGAAAVAAPAPAPLAPARRPGLAVEVVESVRGFDALEREWNGLLERSDASVFQSFEWQRTWWSHFGERARSRRLHLVTIRDGEGLVGVAPLFLERSRVLGLPLRRLFYVGHPDTDYLDLLVERGKEAECAELVAAHLAARPRLLDLAILADTPDGSRTGPLLHEALVRRGWTASRTVGEMCPRTALRASWDETLAALQINYRREIRRRARNIEKAFATELEVVQSGEAVGAAVREFVEMHQERWARDGYWGAFADPRRAEFQGDVAPRLAARGWLELSFLRVGGERVAVNCNFAFRDTVYVYLTGARNRPDLRQYSPGKVVHGLCMSRAVEHGRTVYDFMRGTEHYKYEFGAVDVPNWTIVAYPRSPRRTAAIHALDVLLRGIARRSRRELRLLRETGRAEGWLSRGMLDHLVRGSRRAVKDFLEKLPGRRAPAAKRG